MTHVEYEAQTAASIDAEKILERALDRGSSFGLTHFRGYRMKSVSSAMALTLVLHLGVAIIGTGVSGLAMADETDASQAAEVSKPESAKRICRKEPVMGSNIKRTTCRTQKQVDEQREASQKSMGDFSSRAGGTNGKTGVGGP